MQTIGRYGTHDMMPFPVLAYDGGRVLPFQESHLTERYVAWLNDPEVVRFSEQRYRKHDLAGCRAYYESFAGSANYFLAIEALVPALGHVGNMTIAMDKMNGVADVSILVGDKRVWGTGLASKAWRSVVYELLQNQGVRKVTAGTMSTNASMLRLMDRSRMKIEAIRRRHFLWEGREVDLVLAAAFANEFVEQDKS